MDTELVEAVALIEKVCASVQTNLDGHQAIQKALTIVRKRLDPPEPT